MLSILSRMMPEDGKKTTQQLSLDRDFTRPIDPTMGEKTAQARGNT
jgi:hypothetical protein